MSENSRIEDLRARREKVLRDAENTRRREAYGPKLAAGLSAALDHEMTLADFNPSIEISFKVKWPKCLEEAPGLVAAYVSKERAEGIAQCVHRNLVVKAGLLGIFDNDYLGFCRVEKINVLGMLRASEALNEALVFYPDQLLGALIFDCHKSPADFERPYSVLAQGDSLVRQLGPCLSR